METMPYQADLDVRADVRFQPAVIQSSIAPTVSTDWRDSLPMLAGTTVTLRELRTSDAPSLFALLTTEEVSRFISPPPSTVDGFERFIAWTLRQRAAGTYACFAVTLDATDTAIGIFQLRQWSGLALRNGASRSTRPGARACSRRARTSCSISRSRRSACTGWRAASERPRNGALQKLAPCRSAVRKSFMKNGEQIDQVPTRCSTRTARLARASRRGCAFIRTSRLVASWAGHVPARFYQGTCICRE